MSEFLEKLKERQLDAQKRLQVAQVALQKAQAEHAALAQEFTSWSHAVQTEMRREQQEIGVQQVATPTIVVRAVRDPESPLINAPTTTPPSVVLSSMPTAQGDGDSEINKTNLIRETLRTHPAGMRPVDVWRNVRDQVPRPYVYSVLSRMKQKKQAIERRGKYYLQIADRSEGAQQTS